LPQLNRLKRPPFDEWPFEEKIKFPKGLFGFESYKNYRLVGNKKEIPLLRLESIDNSTLAFYVIDPFTYCPFYEPTLTHTDLKDVGVIQEAKLILLAIVDINSHLHTMNLGAPLLIHWSKKLGKQLLMDQDPEFPLS
jgi:flagellar assembly factor FliW